MTGPSCFLIQRRAEFAKSGLFLGGGEAAHDLGAVGREPAFRFPPFGPLDSSAVAGNRLAMSKTLRSVFLKSATTTKTVAPGRSAGTRTGTASPGKPRKKWQFAADVIGMCNGPRDLSQRKGLAEPFPKASVITTDLADFSVYRRNRNEPLQLICP